MMCSLAPIAAKTFDEVKQKLDLSLCVISALVNDINSLIFDDVVEQLETFNFKKYRKYENVFQKAFDFEDLRRNREHKSIKNRRQAREEYIRSLKQ